MEEINRKKRSHRSYVAGFYDHKVLVHAHSLAAARQLAVEYFRPKKREVPLVQVEEN
jgi:hypothetical protein